MVVKKEIRLKDLIYSGFDTDYYTSNSDKFEVRVEVYHYYKEPSENEGWHDVKLDVDNYAEYKYYFVDELLIYQGGGFRLRISMPPRRIEKFRVFLLKLFKR